jgi:hypothetical protein
LKFCTKEFWHQLKIAEKVKKKYDLNNFRRQHHFSAVERQVIAAANNPSFSALFSQVGKKHSIMKGRKKMKLCYIRKMRQ